MNISRLYTFCTKDIESKNYCREWFIKHESSWRNVPETYRQAMNQKIYKQLARFLYEDGYVVIGFLSESERKEAIHEFEMSEQQFREYRRNENDPSKTINNVTFGTKEAPYVLGGFGAYGNPSSFHNQFVRKMRMKRFRFLIPLFSALLQKMESEKVIQEKNQYKLCALFDRMCRRPVGTSTSKESYHRDLVPNARQGDYTFGGWLQLSNNPSYFECVKGSHVFKTLKSKSGFDRTERGVCTDRILVPPGHFILFFQNIGHCVASVPSRTPSLRVFNCYYLTKQNKPLDDDLEKVIQLQGVPRLPSHQIPPMYSQNHASFFLPSTTQWSHHVFHPKCLVQKHKKDGNAYHIVDRHMKSLQEYGFTLYPVYTDEERKILYPSSQWVFIDGCSQKL